MQMFQAAMHARATTGSPQSVGEIVLEKLLGLIFFVSFALLMSKSTKTL
jgi:hypothetical protein